MKTPDLTAAEQSNVRTALAFLHRRCGTWAATSGLLHFKDTTLGNVANGHNPATITLALRIARVAKVGGDDVLAGKFPAPGTCAMCGHFGGMNKNEER